MIGGIVYAIAAGSLVGLQNVVNSRVQARAGTWATTALALGAGGGAALLIGLASQGPAMFHVRHMELWYAFSGLLAVGVVAGLVQAIRLLGPTRATAIAMSSQLVFALLGDAAGLFGLVQRSFTVTQLLGVATVVIGVLLFKGGDA